ncbi:hypothetical protein P170DRAFT_432203 [Aspergillus steynii IBT 23096]|uniref:F-box domain-containing protein n=1 Tax=Aspergillus steynii IBT 23096 TaxID=1392250 RepID=A0A2I2GNX0_9EURO|nr:uncharacterized protein P170DRAFT_432203 [Aspergillus steynii IBT 23096]PLB54570.1 hypothetical protein P170DRAFT_432203 [Aspergillus steynii IBT 23096]
MLRDLPEEILILVFDLLIERGNPIIDQLDNLKHISNARLVCRLWNTLATEHMFKTVRLMFTDGEYKAWNEMLDSEVIKQTARGVYIHPASADDHPDDIWNAYSECHYDNLIRAISRITELDHITALHLRFSRHCVGANYQSLRDEVVEDIRKRQEILEAVFQAIQRRSNGSNGESPIRSLTIQNLQNAPFSQFTRSELFQDVTRDIDALHLMVADELDEDGSVEDMDGIERRTFESFLHHQWLVPLSNHLVSLTLSFRSPWGTIPGYFDGRGLHFPRLRTLTLGNFVIGHHDQFDWILNQSSLVSLCLDNCSILSYMTTFGESLEELHVQAHDWVQYPSSSFGIDDNVAIYGFSGTWEVVFDNIRTSLRELRTFRFHYYRDSEFPVVPEMQSSYLDNTRYALYGYYGWNHADGRKDLVVSCCQSIHPDAVNRSEETEEGDGRALEALVQEVRKRVD